MGVVCYVGEEGGLELALFTDNGTDEGIVVLDERICLSRTTRLVE